VGVFLIFLSPVIGILALIIMFLGIGIVYVYRLPEDVDSSSPASLTSPLRNSIQSQTDIAEVEEAEPVQAESVEVQVEKPVPESETVEKPIEAISSAELQERIDVLEKRVQSLRMQLAEEAIDDSETTHLSSDTSSVEIELNLDEDEELSELAVRQLLEALEEKLAKRAISKQLYKQLRKKYLARLEKQERRRDTTSLRGKKELATGDE
jgi:hypothetical protein